MRPGRHVAKLHRLYTEWEYLGELLPRGIIDILQQVQTGRFYAHLDHRGLEPSVNRLVLGTLTSALFVGSSMMLSNRVAPTITDISVPGAVGCVASLALGARLLWAIRKSGHLDRNTKS
jgi:ubiquinone biosynthesis protein